MSTYLPPSSPEAEPVGANAPCPALGVCTPGAPITLQAEADTHLVLIGGQPIGQRYIWWNFVSSSRARIEQAKADWKARRFPLIPGHEASLFRCRADHSRIPPGQFQRAMMFDCFTGLG